MSAPLAFRTTRWTVIRRAGSQSDAVRLHALEVLIRQYRPALIEFVHRAYKVPVTEAEEGVQDFLADRVVARDLLAKATRVRGRFRTFLLAAIQSYLKDRHRSEHAQKRRPVNGFHPLEEVPESAFAQAPEADFRELFDEVFSRQVVLESVRRTHAHCLDHALKDAWIVFHSRILAPLMEDAAPTPYEALMRRLGLASEAAAYNKLATAKTIFQRQFRAVVEEYAEDADDKEAEIRYLKRFLNSR